MLEEVHSLIKHGGGGYNFNDVWNMPIFFRRYFIDLIIKENEAIKSKQESQAQQSKGKRK